MIGAKNSAAIAALELWWTGARVTLIHRGAGISDRVKYWIKPNIENRIKNGEIRGYFHSRVLRDSAGSIRRRDARRRNLLKNDFVFALIGYQPDLDFLNATGITLEPANVNARAPIPKLWRANVLESTWPGVIVAGMHTNEIFIENGRFHGQLIAEVHRPQTAHTSLLQCP